MIDLVLHAPVMASLTFLIGVVVIESVILNGWIVVLALTGQDALRYERSSFVRERVALLSDVGKLSMGIGFLGTLIGLITGVAAARNGAHTDLLDSLDVVLETSALGLSARLIALASVLVAAPHRVAWLLSKTARSKQV